MPSLSAGDEPIRFAADGKSLFVGRLDEIPTRVFRLSLADWPQGALEGRRRAFNSPLLLPCSTTHEPPLSNGSIHSKEGPEARQKPAW